MQKLITLFLILGLLTATLVCLAQADSEPMTLRFWNMWTGADGEVLEEIVARFNEVNPYGITIEMDRDSNMNSKMQVAYASNTAPPLTLINTGSIQDLVYQEAIVPIDDIWEKTTLDKNDFVAAILDECSYDGHLYSLPMQVNTRFLYWNKSLLERAGYDPNTPPKTWEELKEMSTAITALDDSIYGGGCPYDFHAGLILMIKDYGG